MTILTASLAVLQFAAVDHTFVYKANAEHQRVNLAGTFNNWNKDAWPMKVDADGRTWRFTTQLAPGKHLYKFVLDGDRWIVDPLAKKTEDDGGGNINTVLIILPKGYDVPARIGDGKLTTSTLFHAPEAPYVNYDRGVLDIRFRCRPNDAERVELWMGKKIVKMAPLASDEIYATYGVKVPWDRKANFDYLFALWDKKAGVNYGAGGLERGGSVIPFRLNAREFKPFTTPEWASRTVMYQIFPDRFENGDPSNDPNGVMPWDGRPTYSNYFGGDFAGIVKRLPHLKSLGIGTIYFNPIFQSPSNHRYETTDYYRVDARLGTNEEFVELTKKLRANGIRTVLDGVFNHSATNWAPFLDVREKGRESKFLEWFYVKSFPVEVRENPPYEAWFGFPSMPKVNLGHPEAAEAMLNVPKHWNDRAEIAGWRLDVANEVPMDYWRQFRTTVKGLRPDMWIIGEHWGDGTPWLKGDQWDSIMNYPLRETWIQFVAQGSLNATETGKRMMANYHLYVPQVARNLMNLLSSHDTPRFVNLCGGDRSLAVVAATLQFGWPGAPSIYYGDELGMDGGRDPDNRRGMEWNRAAASNPVLAHYRKLVAARNASPVLQEGEPLIVHADNAKQSLVYARVRGQEVALIAANRSDKPATLSLNLKGKVPLSSALRRQGFVDALGGGRVSVPNSGVFALQLGPKSSKLLIPYSPRPAVRSGRLDPRHSAQGAVPSHSLTIH